MRANGCEQRHGVPLPQELVDRYEEIKGAVNDKDGICLVEGRTKQLVADGREFHQPTKQWVCSTCELRSLYHNDELTPADLRLLFRTSGKDLLDEHLCCQLVSERSC